MLQRAQRLGHLQAQWVTADDAYGKSPEFRDGVDALGLWYMLEVPGNTPVWPVLTRYFTPNPPQRGRHPDPRPQAAQRKEMQERAQALPASAWQSFTVAEGAQGPRTYLFAFERRRESHDGEPGKVMEVVYRKNLDGSEARYYFSNAPEETSAESKAWVAAARWPIETEFESNKSDVGLDEYEVRGWSGWKHHITLCLLASAFLLTLQQDWKKKSTVDNASPSVSSGPCALASQGLDGSRFTFVA